MGWPKQIVGLHDLPTEHDFFIAMLNYRGDVRYIQISINEVKDFVTGDLEGSTQMLKRRFCFDSNVSSRFCPC